MVCAQSFLCLSSPILSFHALPALHLLSTRLNMRSAGVHQVAALNPRSLVEYVFVSGLVFFMLVRLDPCE